MNCEIPIGRRGERGGQTTGGVGRGGDVGGAGVDASVVDGCSGDDWGVGGGDWGVPGSGGVVGGMGGGIGLWRPSLSAILGTG